MIEESNYCTDIMKKHLTKNLWRLNEIMKILKDDDESSTKFWICDNVYVKNNIKVTNHCQSAHRDCNINVKLTLISPGGEMAPLVYFAL